MRLRTVLILASLATPALAQDFVPTRIYGTHKRVGVGGYDPVRYGGFAQPFIGGDYIGAPLSVVPRPSQIVPTPWSYGTYGIPTVSGISAPPVAAPTLTVIQAPRARRGFHRTSAPEAAGFAGGDPANVQVVNVNVPHR